MKCMSYCQVNSMPSTHLNCSFGSSCARQSTRMMPTSPAPVIAYACGLSALASFVHCSRSQTAEQEMTVPMLTVDSGNSGPLSLLLCDPWSLLRDAWNRWQLPC